MLWLAASRLGPLYESCHGHCQVTYNGYGPEADAWVSLDMLKSKERLDRLDR